MKNLKVKFTCREIEVMACILNLRNPKKIAELLSISPRTVEAHIHNILLKIGANSQESIIDFIETTENVDYLKSNYLEILQRYIIEKQLNRIRTLVSTSKICGYINFNYTHPSFKKFFYHLKLAGVEIVTEDTTELIERDKFKCLFELQLVDDKIIKYSDIFYKYSKTSNYAVMKSDDLLESESIIDLNSINYYSGLYTVLFKCLSKIENKELFKELKELENHTNNTKINIDKQTYVSAKLNPDKITEPKDRQFFLSKENKFYYKLGLILTTILFLATTCYLLFSSMGDEFKVSAINYQTFGKVIDDINSITLDDISANNMQKAQWYDNHNIVKKIESILYPIVGFKGRIGYHSVPHKTSASQLIKYAYVLHALSNYYLYHYPSTLKAKEFLKHLKDVIENYILVRSFTPINFDKLSHKELYIELNIAKDLPEIYTRVLYSLARTELYQDNIKALRYFETVEQLGNHLELFEGYLSLRSGIAIIESENIKNYIKNKEYNYAREKLHRLIDLYINLKNNSSFYKIDYTPSKQNQELINPSKDLYNQADCMERIVKCYNELINITNDITQKEEYVKKLFQYFLDSSTQNSILDLTPFLPQKKVASIFNTLGNVLLSLYNQNISFKNYVLLISSKLNLSANTETETIEEVFNLAIQESRNTNAAKKTAYIGLMSLYKQIIKYKKLTTAEHIYYLDLISVLKGKVFHLEFN
ncbi:Helix-turn-helix transcriptional regulator (plasmid) [Candidatus Trichorickettsia mobilis]|nr:Helix-turn-helix transcriptional regulator [Candidatus Trichorickettsia mobilis]